MKRLTVAMIKIYQKVISPALPRSCRFIPSCSEYAAEAIEKHGLIRGGLMACGRILRCSPLSKGGYDPVK